MAKIVINMEKARAIGQKMLDQWAIAEAQKRSNIVAIGLKNTVSDTEFVAKLNAARAAIAAATTTDKITEVVTATEAELTEN